MFTVFSAHIGDDKGWQLIFCDLEVLVHTVLTGGDSDEECLALEGPGNLLEGLNGGCVGSRFLVNE